MAEFITEGLIKRRNRIWASSDNSASSPDYKKSGKTVSNDAEIAEEDKLLTALDMTANLTEKLEQIVERLTAAAERNKKWGAENKTGLREKDINDLKEKMEISPAHSSLKYRPS